jgi:hypothetical protein
MRRSIQIQKRISSPIGSSQPSIWPNQPALVNS